MSTILAIVTGAALGVLIALVAGSALIGLAYLLTRGNDQ